MTSKQSSSGSPTPRRITRASLQKISARSLSLAEEPQSGNSTTTLAKKTSKVKKNVKFLDSSIEETIKNCSMISDEGIDMSFSPHLKIPSAITRPQHKLKQVIQLISSHSFIPILYCFWFQHWSWWYSARKRNLSWSQNQLHVSSMATVEEFWHCYNQVDKKNGNYFEALHLYHLIVNYLYLCIYLLEV